MYLSNKESILIFGAGDNQKTLILSAKQLGYRTIVIDPNPSASSKFDADIFEVIEPKDKVATIEIAQKFNVKGIVTSQMENPLFLMAEIAEELGYIFPSKISIANARNKWLMKQCFLEHQVPCSKGIKIQPEKNIEPNDIVNLKFPLIIKPLDSFSSRGVFKVNTFDEIFLYIDITRKFSSTGDIILEEFIEGPEVSVESVTYNGETHTIQITDKVITPFPTAVEMEHIQPSNQSLGIQAEIKKIVEKAIKSLDLDTCATHAELKISPDGIKMVEIGARLGGDFITSHLVPLSTGINIEAAAIQIAMGKKPNITQKNFKTAVIKYLNLPEGRKIKYIGNWQEILDYPNVKYALITANIGEIIPHITDSAKRKGFVIVQMDNRNDAIIYANEALNQLSNYFILE